MREEFEAWARSRSMDLEYRNIPGVGQFYQCPRTLLALEAWQASRADWLVELPSRVDTKPYACYESGWNDMRREAVDAIEAAGLKVAP